MSQLEYSLPMDRAQVARFLPHRPPILLVDEVLEYNAEGTLHAIRHIDPADPILPGHFPGNPIVPGVLVVEGMAQASAILGQLMMQTHFSICLLLEIEKCRFRRQVVPGDILHYRVRMTGHKKQFYWFEAEASVADALVAAAGFSAKLA